MFKSEDFFIDIDDLELASSIGETTFKKLKLYSFERQDKNIIIGDSQSPYVDWGSDKFELISKNSGVNSLWQSGKTLSWLLDAVNNYKTSYIFPIFSISFKEE